MKILHLSPRFAFPPDDGGKIVLSNTFKHFATAGNDVRFFCFSQDPVSDVHMETAKQYGDVIPYPHRLNNSIGRAVESIVTRQSVYLMKHYSDEILSFLVDLQHKEKFDVIHCEHSSMAPLGLKLKEIFNVPVGLRLHNIEYRIWELYGKELPFYNPLKYYIAWQARLLQSAERKIYSEVDVCFTITEDDRELAKRLSPKANVVTSGVGMDFNKWKISGKIEKDNHSMLLATTYKWIHNVDGLQWFIDNVLPLVRKEIPDAKLRLLGKEPPEKFKNYADAGVEVVGYVDDVLPYFEQSAVYIAPLFVGAGVRIKILEAMAMELPVVATRVSAAGIKAGNSEGLFVTDDPQESADAIISLMRSPEHSAMLGKNALRFIQENFSWQDNIQIMLDNYKKILGGR